MERCSISSSMSSLNEQEDNQNQCVQVICYEGDCLKMLDKLKEKLCGGNKKAGKECQFCKSSKPKPKPKCCLCQPKKKETVCSPCKDAICKYMCKLMLEKNN